MRFGLMSLKEKKWEEQEEILHKLVKDGMVNEKVIILLKMLRETNDLVSTGKMIDLYKMLDEVLAEWSKDDVYSMIFLSREEIVKRFQNIGVDINGEFELWRQFYSEFSELSRKKNNLIEENYKLEFPEITLGQMRRLEYLFENNEINSVMFDDTKLNAFLTIPIEVYLEKRRIEQFTQISIATINKIASIKDKVSTLKWHLRNDDNCFQRFTPGSRLIGYKLERKLATDFLSEQDFFGEEIISEPWVTYANCDQIIKLCFFLKEKRSIAAQQMMRVYSPTTELPESNSYIVFQCNNFSRDGSQLYYLTKGNGMVINFDYGSGKIVYSRKLKVFDSGIKSEI